jgi:uncharacterized protein (TIGR02118 family)
MAATKLIVIYPAPKDVEAFERAYAGEHIPMAAPAFKAAGATRAVLTKIVEGSGAKAPFHRIAEIHFPSSQVLAECLASEAGRDVLAHARQISNGGPPTVMTAEEEVVSFT